MNPDSRAQTSFTFQSGTIQARYRRGQRRNNRDFTFQSGTIQAKMRPLERAALTSLHSNLVQFKRMAICQAGRAAGIFTFQSGTIQAKKYQRVQ